jgi:putative transposase
LTGSALSPRIISDNGPQFIAGDFKKYIRLTGMTRVRTAPYYPQSNGKIERVQKTLKVDAIRVKNPATLEEARRVVATFVEHYNQHRLHSAIDYVTPADRLKGRHKVITAERDRKLESAREREPSANPPTPAARCADRSGVCPGTYTARLYAAGVSSLGSRPYRSRQVPRRSIAHAR